MARFPAIPSRAGGSRERLAASAKQWGSEGKRRYAALLAAAMNKVAADPEGLTTRSRPELRPVSAASIFATLAARILKGRCGSLRTFFTTGFSIWA